MNNDIETFNRDLNISVASDDTFLSWVDYRKVISVMATDNLWRNGSCFLLGAGNMCDIDLGKFRDLTTEIVLADIDTDAIKSGIVRQGIDVNRIRIEKTDLGGLDKSEVIKNVTAYLAEGDSVTLKDYLRSFEFATEFKRINFDNVLVSAIYTQLFIPQFLMLLQQQNQLSMDVKQTMLESALEFAARFIAHVNDEIMSLAADGASVCAWSDILEYAIGDPALIDVEKHIGDTQWMDELYQSYLRDYGHGLGSYGISNLVERLGSITEKWILWPFDENRKLVVKIMTGTVTS